MARFCRYCGTENPENAAFCQGCGKPVPVAGPQRIQPVTPKFCRKCGGPLNPGAQFCKECGWKISAAAAAQVSAPVSNSRQTQGQAGRRVPIVPVIAVILAAVLFVCFVFPGSVRTALSGGGSGISSGMAGGGRNGKESSGIPEPVQAGNSRAFSIEPRKGIRISAEENAMDKDRAPVFSELPDEDYARLDKEAQELGAVMLDAYDFSIGLAEDEAIPGEYVVEYDLAAAGLEEDVWPYVYAFRVLEDGTKQPYTVELDGSVAYYRSHQNTIAEWMVILPIVYGTMQIAWFCEEYGEMLKKDRLRAEITENQQGFVLWSVDDFAKYPDNRNEIYDAALAKRKELENQYLDMATKAYPLDAYGHGGPDEGYAIKTPETLRKRNSDISNAAAGLMKADSEYRQQVEICYDAYPLPVRTVLQRYGAVWQYLKGPEQGARMPSQMVCIFFVPGGGDAETHKVAHGRNAIIKMEIDGLYKGISDPLSDTEGVNKGETSALATLTHEMFHACQYEYFFFLSLQAGPADVKTYNTLLMESTAAVVEAEGFLYFQRQGMTPGYETTSLKDAMQPDTGCLTSRNLFHYYGLEIDRDGNTPLGNDPGYQWANFLDYLNEKKGRHTMAEVMSCYSETGIFSDAVRGAYQLDADTFRQLEWDFLADAPRKEFLENVGFAGGVTPAKGIFFSHDYKEKDTAGYHHDALSTGGYIRVHRLKTPGTDKKYGLLLLDTMKEKDGEFSGDQKICFLTAEAWGIRKSTASAPSRMSEGVKVIDSFRNFIYVDPEFMYPEIAVIEQAAWSTADYKSGFKALLMRQPDPPKYEMDERKLDVLIYLPEIPGDSFLKDDDFADVVSKRGYMVYATRKDGKKFEEFIPLEAFKGKKPAARIPAEALLEGTTPEGFENDVKLEIAEAFKVGEEDDGKIYTGPKSEPQDENLLVLYGRWELTNYLKDQSAITDGMIGKMESSAHGAGSEASQVTIDSIDQYSKEYAQVEQELETRGRQGTPATMVVRPKAGGSQLEYEAVITFPSVQGRPPMIFEGVYDEKEKTLYFTQTDATSKGSNGVTYDFADFGMLASLTLKVREEGRTLACSGDIIVNSNIVSYLADIEGKKTSNSYDDFDAMKGGR